MKLAIMQPYFFPYIGYFQLIHAVDKFVIYDDVNYIKQGWVNRNSLLGKAAPTRITIPLAGASSNKLINQIEVDNRQAWSKKMTRTIEQTYSKAPYFKEVFPLVKKILDTPTLSIAGIARKSITDTCDYLGVTAQIIDSSSTYENTNLSGANRVLDICKQENAQTYINPIGGRKLYSKKEFQKHGIDLRFLQSKTPIYTQYEQPFQPSLSIIDIMMFCSKQEIAAVLDQYTLE